MIYISLKEYLAKLESKAIEADKQESTQSKVNVPTLSDISREANIHYTNVSKIANNRAKQLNLETLNKIIQVVRKRGFDMKIEDLLEYREEPAPTPHQPTATYQSA